MPFYGKQTLLNKYRTWNVRKRKSLSPYIKIVHGTDFWTELQLTIGQGRRHKPSPRPLVACPNQEKKDKPSTLPKKLLFELDDKKSVSQDPSSLKSEPPKDLNPKPQEAGVDQEPHCDHKVPTQGQDGKFTSRRNKRIDGKLGKSVTINAAPSRPESQWKVSESKRSKKDSLAKIQKTGSNQKSPKQLERPLATGGRKAKTRKRGKQNDPLEAERDDSLPNRAMRSQEDEDLAMSSSVPAEQVHTPTSHNMTAVASSKSRRLRQTARKLHPIPESLLEVPSISSTLDPMTMSSSGLDGQVQSPTTHKVKTTVASRKSQRQKAAKLHPIPESSCLLEVPSISSTLAPMTMSSSGLNGQVRSPTTHKVKTTVASRKSRRQKARKLDPSPESSCLLEVPTCTLDPSTESSAKHLSVKIGKLPFASQHPISSTSSNQQKDPDVDDQDCNHDGVSLCSLRNACLKDDRESPRQKADTLDTVKSNGVPASESVYNQYLWNLTVASDIKNVPLLEDDEERKSPQSSDANLKTTESCGKSWLHPCTPLASEEDIFQETMPLGEDVNNNSIVNESVDDEGHSDSPACQLPGLSHLQHRPASDLPVHAQPTGPASEHTQDQRNFTANASSPVFLQTLKAPVLRMRKRGRTEDGVRGHSGWEESLRQRPATISRFQAGDPSPITSPKKPEAKTEKKKWQSPPSKKLKRSEDADGQPHDPVDQKTNDAVLPTSVSLSVLQDRYLYGEIVWGKMKGFNWWPGLVVHHYTCRREPAPSDACWVNWFGDNKFSKLNLNQVVSFQEFPAHFSKTTFLHTALYRKAVFHGLALASKRAVKAFSADPNPFLVDQPKNSRHYSTAWMAFMNLCDEMISWASEGFQPSGPEGIKPTQDEQQVPVRPRSPSPPPSPRMSTPSKRATKRAWKDMRETVMEEVRNGSKDIQAVCLGCGSSDLSSEHPFFIGGMCDVCRVDFIEAVYVFDEEGYQCYCCICAEGKDIILCDQAECYRSFCYECLDYLVGPGTVLKVLSKEHWSCYLCDPESTPAGLLSCRSDWAQKLQLLFQRDNKNFSPLRSYPPVDMAKRRPIRVLSLFDGIGTGMVALKELGVMVDCYLASEINEEAIKVSSVRHDGVIQQLDDVRQITEQGIRSLGPIDLVIGGSPCNELSIANPARKGLYEGTGRLFFDFYRLLTAARPSEDSDRPFFWLFENVVGMANQDKIDISRFLQCDPVVVDAKDVSPAHRARYFWGNLPGMNRPKVTTDNAHLHLQDCLEPNCNRQAQVDKVRTVTTKINSLKQKNERLQPVMMNGQEDTLWSTEMERIFGFPEHYTDIGNMSRTSRHRLIGQAWSVPVIKHLLAPLKEYFTCETHQ
ncbi:DNA (cytosine-5)-methyltransferase 3A-like isoform X2 [Asterias amurensis]|uniref:DNA (cytosine-5)-methyltransferase 3A-like isoform X2 n=1 Tax=Asterias amurensis TaxID=7602 RepID=UPI003AB88466